MIPPSSQKTVKIFSYVLIMGVLALFTISFALAKLTSLPLPQQAKGGVSFYISTNEAIQWESGSDILQLQLQLLESDRALINLYINGKISRFFISKGVPLSLDVTEDGQADGTITLVNFEGNRGEFRMTSTTEEVKKVVTQPTTQQTNQQTTTSDSSQQSL